MKDDKKDSGQELIDIDEKGNPIEKEKKEKIRKTNIKYKICLSIYHFNYHYNIIMLLLFQL